MKTILLSQAEVSPSYGGKINSLINLKKSQFSVPEGLILPEDEVSSWWKPYVRDLLQEGNSLLNLRESLLQSIPENIVPDNIQKELAEWIESDKTYIVRSSALLEDGDEASFAGQYESVLNCQGLSEVVAAIGKCVQSLFSQKSLTYWEGYQSDFSQFGMSLLVQEQILATTSGVCFSLIPNSDKDQTFLVECVSGLGVGLVDGSCNPESLYLPWFEPIDVNSNNLSNDQLSLLRDNSLAILELYGQPMDIEFSFVANQLYLLQARPITKMAIISQEGQWTTAKFRDGGVAAQPCPHLMYSLYRQAWQLSLTSFMEQARLVKKNSLGSLMQLKFARPYWNIGEVKKAMAQIPGYVEKDFDDELGISKNYEGFGYQSKLSPKTVFKLLKVAWHIRQISKSHQASMEQKNQSLLERYAFYENNLSELSCLEDTQKLWLDLVNKDQLEAETTYFWQVFINTVQLSMKKTAILKCLSPTEFFTVMANLGSVSHVEPILAIIGIVDSIRSNQVYVKEWRSLALKALVEKCQIAIDRPDFNKIHTFQDEFGYHSSRELNLLVPSYSEDLSYIIELIQGLVKDDVKYEQLVQSLNSTLDIDVLMEDLGARLSRRQFAKVMRLVKQLRELLWWRESFKDISTRYYHLVRQYTLTLGHFYQQMGILEFAEDLFYLTLEETFSFIEGKLSSKDLQDLAIQNRLYCQAYCNYEPPGDLYTHPLGLVDDSSCDLTGLPANGGLVRAKVRVITDVKDIKNLEAGEILVTRFTDTGWSHAFGSLAGLITEYGGVLCHASIVARECQLPTLVCVNNATKLLKTGMTVTLDAYSGHITIHEE